MNYYTRPEGTERMLRSRIRRCFVVLAELKQAVDIRIKVVDRLSEEVATEHLSNIAVMYREAYLALTGITDEECIDHDDGLEQAQERLLNAPESAEHVRHCVEEIYDAASGVIRDLAYRVDAVTIDPDNPLYQNIREQAIKILGTVDVISKAVDSGFIRDVRGYQLYGE